METKRKTRMRRGSALSLVLILGLLLLVMLASFMNLATKEYVRSDSALVYNSLINLVDAGTEETFWALNNNDWSEWKEWDSYKYQRLPDFDLGQSRKGEVELFLEIAGDDVRLWVEARVKLSSTQVATKQVRLNLGRQSLFSAGLVAMDSLDFKGNRVVVDSYDSGKGAYNDFFNRNDQIQVVCLSPDAGSVSVQNGDIYGYLNSNGVTPDFNAQGRVYGADTVADTQVDWSRISTNYYAKFPTPSAPAMKTPITVLPAASKKGVITLGSDLNSVPTYYQLPEISLKSNQTIEVIGPVIAQVTGSIDIKGGVTVTSNGRLQLYVEDEVVIGGKGMVNNTNVPANCLVYGLNVSGKDHSLKISGNGAFIGAVYAPDWSLELLGAGNSGIYCGAAVAQTVKFTGNYGFHFDEQLKDMPSGNGGYLVRQWLELVNHRDRVDFAVVRTGTTPANL